MAFDNKDFVQLLKFYKNAENFPLKAKKSFNTLSEVSKSDDEYEYPLIINDNCIFDLDNMCWNSHLKNNGSVKSNRPSSVDGLHFVNGKLYLIEFKGTYNATLDLEEIMDKCIEKNR